MEGLRLDRATVRRAVPGDRERLIAALAPLSPAATGIPASATLVVRKLTMPVPLPRSGSPDHFAATLRDQLRARLAGAVRGSHRPADADYLFEDDAALEVAIVADWLAAPSSTGRRWWTSVVGTAAPLERWRRHLLLDVTRLPHIVARLVEAGWAAEWLTRFEPGELAAATRRLIVAAGGLPPPLSAVATSPVAAPAKISAGRAGRLQSGKVDPIVANAPEACDFTTGAVRALAAVSLVLVRRPALVTTQSFLDALAQLAAAPRVAQSRGARRDPEPGPSVAGFAFATVDERRERRTQPRSKDGAAAMALPLPASALAALPEAAVDNAETLPSNPTRGVRQADVATSGNTGGARGAPDGTKTEFGGLFFLLNAFVALGLYGDFTRPADGVRGLSPFELLDLLGRRWFGATYRTDPLASLLPNLAGLPAGNCVGQDFEAPVWTIPSSWLTPWPPAKLQRCGGAYWHPAGFPVTDDASQPFGAAGRRRRWVYCLARYLEARLQLATGGDAALALVCRRSATISHDFEALEIGFALDTHPIAVRLAGLDRNLGWMPATGRRIGFVFT